MSTPTYPTWRAIYSNEGFGRAQALADQLTEEDRRAGRPAPAVGYSGERFEDADAIVRAAQTY